MVRALIAQLVVGNLAQLIEDLRYQLVERVLAFSLPCLVAAAKRLRAYSARRGGGYDLILLDLMLPKKSGFDACRDLRQQGVKTSIVMLTARGEVIDKVLGLRLGADDDLTKPFA